MGSNNPYYNAEGYPDPTAYYGERHVRKEEREAQKRADRLIGTIKLFCDLAGFDLICRIQLRDRASGREYR